MKAGNHAVQECTGSLTALRMILSEATGAVFKVKAPVGHDSTILTMPSKSTSASECFRGGAMEVPKPRPTKPSAGVCLCRSLRLARRASGGMRFEPAIHSCHSSSWGGG